MPDFLFVYGTLLPGHAPPAMRATCERLRRLGAATVVGNLYDLGPYPAVVMDAVAGSATVRGDVVEVDCDETWRKLDRYEGCPRPGGDDGLFRRIKTVATLETGEAIDCWIYVYNRGLDRARVIESGCWRTHRNIA